MAANAVSGSGNTRAGETEKIPITREGLEEKKARLDYLVNERRQQIADYIHEAKEAGDISESSAYEDAKNSQAMLEGEIQELQRIIDNAVILNVQTSPMGSELCAWVPPWMSRHHVVRAPLCW